MLGRTHIAIALFIFLLVLNIFSFENYLLFLLLLIIGSLLPDIDRSSSYLGRFAGTLPLVFSHRGFFHSAYAMILFSAVVYFIGGFLLAIAFSIGYFSHLVFDSFTKKGVAFFLIDRKIKGPFVSGGLFDKFVFSFILLLNIYLAIIMFL
ncbi:MAG: metal-dependent hydrolase [archaeon]